VGVDVRLRASEPADHPLLLRLFASTREVELAYFGSDDERAAFVSMQFAAQDRAYRGFCADAEFSVVLVDDEPAGRVVLHREPGAMTLVDIALLPECRGKGVGTRLLTDMMDAADSAGVPLRLHVEGHSPARRLYERLGFEALEDDGRLLAMEYRCATSPR
jgi:ribosomal protein S18 acetylase RimI-like enzyme